MSGLEPISKVFFLRTSPERGEVPGVASGGAVPTHQVGRTPSPLVGRTREGATQGGAFAASKQPIPVTVVTAGELTLPGDAALVTVAPEAGHDHPGTECLVCATRGNVRVLLFELLQQARLGAIPAFASVVVDARRANDPQAVVDALVPNRLPAFGLRDHTVLRSFRLA